MTTSTRIETGQPVPDLTLVDDTGADVALRDLAGRRVVLYFYPKDDTPGCTTQACDLRDSWSEFEGIDDLVVYGVSPDGAESHRKFRAKHDLPFHLLVDEEHRLAEALGFWVEKSMYGKTYWGVERSTVVVGADGTVIAIAHKVKPAEHVAWLRGVLELG
ncbi:MAG: alkyl hydroperoxide reductase/Thiol specific antioxidant/Mal allergen [Thermoleophilia bacterium]|nr:alkyl hydroperoxide reductase/Thiol specific antioxidant/Mal allergen [Thermoleophilia bacterium]